MLTTIFTAFGVIDPGCSGRLAFGSAARSSRSRPWIRRNRSKVRHTSLRFSPIQQRSRLQRCQPL